VWWHSYALAWALCLFKCVFLLNVRKTRLPTRSKGMFVRGVKV
jgi:hypothetical protein